MFADTPLNVARLGQLIVNCFAVGGGFLVGYIFTTIVGWLLDRFLLRRKTPGIVHRGFRMLGGLAMAVLVAIIVFGHGFGWTLFGGGQEGSANDSGNQISTTTSEPSTPPPVPVTNPTTNSMADEWLRVTILGGTDVKDQKFYLIDDDQTPRTLGDAKATVLRRKDGSTRSLGLAVRFAVRNTLPPDHPAVLQLTKWAREVVGLTVTFPAD